TLNQIFEKQASISPYKEALVYKDETLNYKELNEKANIVAHELIERGIQNNEVVGIMIDRSMEMMISILGVLKAGAAYLPIDPNTPLKRIEYIVSDSGTTEVITLKKHEKVLTNISVNILLIDDVEQGNTNNPNIYQDVTDLAYVIYTSGSTGNPKGVMVEHKSAINFVEWFISEFEYEKDIVLLQKTPIIFDVSVSELFSWYFKAGKLVIMEPFQDKDPDEILKVIVEQKITHVNFVPSLLTPFLEGLETSNYTERQITSLKYIIVAGEILRKNQMDKFFHTLPKNQVSLVNMYGPTEATVGNCIYYTNNQSDIIPIGKPITNTDIYILNTDGNQQPIGQVGEIYI
uniref:AMP-binding protein n=1 Tax=Staphylococcus xylosus TaxID=1288 RepID=UPI003F566514